jgi:hypothetical protein
MSSTHSVKSISTTLIAALVAILCCLGAGVASAAQVSLAWDANSESNLAGYHVYYNLGSSGAPYTGNGLDQGASPVDVPLASLDDAQNPRVSLSGLVAGTYYITCTAYDSEGNESGYANEISYTVVVDELPPDVPSDLAAVPLNANQAMLTWSPVVDNGDAGLAGYRIFRDGQQIASTTETIFMDNGLLAATVYTYTVAAYDAEGNTSALTTAVTAQTLDMSDLSLRINCGGDSYLDSAGHQWSADSGSNGGSTASVTGEITRTQDDVLFQSERWDSATGNLAYGFNVPNGDYQVNLFFADVYSGTQGNGLRVFDTLIENQLRLDDLDIYAEVGPEAALIRSFSVTVFDGLLEIEFVSQVENAKICAIEILSKGFAALPQYSLTATAGANGSISPNGTTTLDQGDSQTYTITPAAHYHVANVYVDNASVGAVSSYRFDAVDTDHTIRAEFAIDTYSVSADGGSEGAISPSGTTMVAYGDSLTFQITPNAHREIADVFVNDASVGAVSSYTLNNIDRNTSITANFVADSHTVTATAGANGTLTPAGETLVTCGQSVTYTITPAANHHVSDVQVNGQSVGAVTTHTLNNITADATIMASFAIDQYTITATAGENGQIAPTGQQAVPHGGSATYTITPDQGYHVETLSVDGQSQDILESYTFSNVSAAHTIQASFVADNQAPVANAGPDQQVAEGQVVTLSAANSIDPDDGIQSYIWAQVGGAPVTLNNAQTETPSFTAPDVDIDGLSLTFQVTVRDFAGLEDTDSAIVNVSWVNTPPVAATGPNRTVAEGETVSLDGTNSSDADDGIDTYLWEQIDGPSVTLSDAHSAQPTFNAPDVGPEGESLSFQLTVKDNGGLQATATCIINVSWINVGPVANAGANQTVVEGATVMLDGSNSMDTDNGIETYYWTQLEGTPVQLSDPSAVQPVFTAPDTDTQGAHLVFQLTVTDAGGLQGQATCIVNVSWQNLPPEANAGEDQQVSEGTSVILDATVSSDSDDGIATYQWSQVSGPAITLSDAGDPQPSFTTPDVGPQGASLVFRLTVSDQAGLQSEDECIVTVTWENQPPVAHAGTEQTVAENTTVTLDGSRSTDTDDGLDTFLWSQVSGRAITLSDPAAMRPAFMVPGDVTDGEQLIFRLTVTDMGGLQDDALCTITVDRSQPQDTTAPTIKISLPTNAGSYITEEASLDLSGSATDDGGVVSVSWQVGQGTISSADGTTAWSVKAISLPLGTSVICITAVDGAGNSASTSLTVTRKAVVVEDTEAPNLTFLAPTTGNFYFTKRSYLGLSGTATDNDQVSKVTWTYSNGVQGTADGTDTWSVSRISLKKWFNTITVTAVDPAGNTTTKTLTVLRWGW